MDFDSYQMQVLVLVAKNCRPNSPIPDRAWWKPTPIYGCERFGNMISILIRDGFLKRKHGYRVKPSELGYETVAQWKVYRGQLKQRPLLYSPIVWEPRLADLT